MDSCTFIMVVWLVKLRFVELFGDWILTRMIVFIVTNYEPSALSIELVSVFDANAPPLMK